MTDADGLAIRTHALEKHYGELVAVRSLDLEVERGEVFGLLGPNGAGKTTTILMLLGLTERTSGEAWVLGLDPARQPLRVKRQVGYLPDNVGFYGSLSGRENLRYTARLNGIEAAEAERRIGELLEQVQLADAGDAPVETYSRGMKQRLGLADALIKEPSVVILDEPTTAIDPTGVIETLALVRSLARDRGAAVLLSSHLLHQVQQVCDRIAIFVAGEVVATGTVQELAERQSHGAISRFEVGADGDPAEVAATLRSVDGVAAVEPDERDTRIWIVSGEPEVRQRVAQALVAAGQTPWHLRTRGMELDEIYQRYFTGTSLPPSRRTRAGQMVPEARAEQPAAVSTAERRRQRRAIHRSSRRSGAPRETDRDG